MNAIGERRTEDTRNACLAPKGGLLRHVDDTRPKAWPPHHLGSHVAQTHLTAHAHTHQTDERPEERRLARAGRSTQKRKRTFCELERDLLEQGPFLTHQ